MSEPDPPVTLTEILGDLLGRELTPEECKDLDKPYIILSDMPPHLSRQWPPRGRMFLFPEDGQEDFPPDEDK